jgi:hypothetical protein
MKKEDYIKATLIENIEISDKTIKELYDEIDEINTLPDNCLGVEIDGMICENPSYKRDLLTGNYHIIGYMEALRELSKDMLKLNAMDDENFQQYLIEQEEIHKNNQLEIEKMNEIINNKLNKN